MGKLPVDHLDKGDLPDDHLDMGKLPDDHLDMGELPVDHLDEGESNTSTKPPVGHDELLLQVDLLQAEPGGNFYLLEHFEGHVDPLLVGNECEDVDTDEADEEAEDDRP